MMTISKQRTVRLGTCTTCSASCNPMHQYCSRECQSEDIRHACLVGPLSNIKGIGPIKMDEILLCRKTGKPLRPALAKLLENAVTEIDNLSPISNRIQTLHPDLTAIGIRSKITPINKVQCGVEGAVVIAGVAMRIAPRDENDLQKVAKRGYKFSGPTICLNMFVRDDGDEIFCKIDRYDFERLATPIIEHGRAGNAIYALKGTVPLDFRMIAVNRIIYLGDMKPQYDESLRHKDANEY
jgi:hypothetical protein